MATHGVNRKRADGSTSAAVPTADAFLPPRRVDCWRVAFQDGLDDETCHEYIAAMHGVAEATVADDLAALDEAAEAFTPEVFAAIDFYVDLREQRDQRRLLATLAERDDDEQLAAAHRTQVEQLDPLVTAAEAALTNRARDALGID